MNNPVNHTSMGQVSPAIVNQIDAFAHRVITVENESDLWTTSLHVAEEFGKQHKDVIRAIENLECSEEFNQRNFAPVTYTDAKGESRKMYRISEDGFMMLVMGFTGKKAMGVKEKWVGAFRWMRDELRRLTAMPADLPSALRAYADQLDRSKELQGKVDELMPKARYAEQLTKSVTCKQVKAVAKVLDMGPIKLFAWLRDHKFLMDGGEKGDRDPNHNVPYQKHIDAGLFRLGEGRYQHPESREYITYTVTLITAKGQLRIYKMLKEQGLIKDIPGMEDRAA